MLTASGMYRMTQVLHSGTTATYFNLLEVNAGPYAVTGNYSCEVANSLGVTRINAMFEGQQ